jgi:hypothetical protein
MNALPIAPRARVTIGGFSRSGEFMVGLRFFRNASAASAMAEAGFGHRGGLENRQERREWALTA